MWQSFQIFKYGIVRAIEFAVILSVAILVLDVLWGVAARFILETPSRWTEELATFLLVWVALLSAALAFERNEHLGVDYLVNKFDSTGKRILEITTLAIVSIFVLVAMIYGGIVLVSETLAAGQVTPALGIKMGYVYLAAPITGLVMLCTCIDRVVKICKGEFDLHEEHLDDT